MNITQQNQDGLKYHFTATVSANELEKQMDKELKKISKQVKMNGFRPGKVPMKVVKQKYGKNVIGEVVQNSVDDAARKIFTQEKIRPADKPQIEIANYEEGKDLTFTMDVEVIPPMPEIDFSTISVEKYVYDIEDSEVEEALERLAGQQKDFAPKAKDSKAEQGDAVKIDFIGRIDGDAFEGGTANDVQLELGGGQFIPGFEDQLVGSKAGDKVDVKVTFPESYHKADLAGKEAVFETTVNEVLSAEAIKEYDDAFAKKIGFDTIDTLKDMIKTQLSNNYQEAAHAKEKKVLFDALDEKVDVEAPGGMVAREFDAIWQQYTQAKEAGQIDEDDKKKSDDELKTEYREVAVRRVKLGLLLAHIAEENKILVSKEELQQAIMRQARGFPGQEQRVMEFYKENPQHMEELRGPILEEKAVQFVLEKVKREDVKTTTKALLEEDEEGAKAA